MAAVSPDFVAGSVQSCDIWGTKSFQDFCLSCFSNYQFHLDIAMRQ